MNILKKLIASLSAFAVVTTTMLPAITSAQVSDPELQDAVDRFIEGGYTNATSFDGFNVNGTLSREASAKFFEVFAQDVLGMEPDTSKDCTFSDINTADSTLVDSIKAACQLGLIKGSNGKFMPKASLNRMASTLILGRMLYEDQTDIDDADAYFDKLNNDGYMKYKNFDQLLTRGNLSLLLFRIAKDYADETNPETCALLGICPTTPGTGTVNTGTTIPAIGGNLMVALSSATPAETILPKGSQNVVYTTLTFTADKDTVIKGLKLRRGDSNGTRNAFDGVFLRKDQIAITNERTIQINDTVEFSNLNIVVKGGETLSLEVVANMNENADTFSKNRFILDNMSGVVSNGTVGGSFPIMGNEMTVGAVGVPTLAVRSQGIPSNPTLGQENALLGSLRFEADDANNVDKSIRMYSVTLENAGNIDIANLTNLGLYDGSTMVASARAVAGDRVTLVFSGDYVITDGNTKSLDLRANIIGGRANDTIGRTIDRNSDVVGYPMDKQVGVSVRSDVNGTKLSLANQTLNIPSTIAGVISPLILRAADVVFSDLQVTKQDLSRNSTQNVVLMSKLYSAREIEVRKVDMTLTLNDNGAGDNVIASDAIRNIKIVDENGSTLASTTDLKSFGFTTTNTVTLGAPVSFTKTFNDSFNVSAMGSGKRLHVEFDLAPTADIDLSSVVVKLSFAGTDYIRDAGTNKYVATTAISPTSVESPTHNVVDTTINVFASSNVLADTFVQGSTNVKIGGFTFKATNANALKLRSVKVSFTGANYLESQDIYENVRLVSMSGSTMNVIDTSSIDSSTDTITFDNFATEPVIAKGGELPLILVANIKKGLTSQKVISARLANPTTDVSAIKINNDGTNGDVVAPTILLAQTSVSITIDTVGTFTITPNSVDTRDQIVVAGTSKEVARYELKPSKEGFKVRTLSFVITGTAVYPEIIDSAKLVIGSTEFPSSSIVLDGLNQIIKFSNVDYDVTATTTAKVLITFANMDANGTNSAKGVKVLFYNGTNDVLRIEGIGSNANPVLNTVTDATTNRAYFVRKAKLTFAKLPVDTITSLNASQIRSLYKFTVTNGGSDSSDIGRLVFKVNGTAIPTNIELYRNGELVPTLAFAGDAALTVVSSNVVVNFDPNNQGKISGNEVVTYELRATVAAPTPAQSLNVDVLDDNDGSNVADLINNNLINTKSLFSSFPYITTNNLFIYSDGSSSLSPSEDFTDGYGLNLDALTENAFSNSLN